MHTRKQWGGMFKVLQVGVEKPDNMEFDIQQKISFKTSRKIKILQKNKSLRAERIYYQNTPMRALKKLLEVDEV